MNDVGKNKKMLMWNYIVFQIQEGDRKSKLNLMKQNQKYKWFIFLQIIYAVE